MTGYVPELSIFKTSQSRNINQVRINFDVHVSLHILTSVLCVTELKTKPSYAAY